MNEDKKKKIKRYKRRFNTRLVKLNLSYPTQDIAELFNVSISTVNGWYKLGLKKNDEKKPCLVFGKNLIDFLNGKNTKRKQKCNAESFFCCKCQVIRKAWGNVVDINVIDSKRMMVTGLCEQCNSKINKLVSTKKIDECQKIFTVQVIQNKQLIGCDNTSGIAI